MAAAVQVVQSAASAEVLMRAERLEMLKLLAEPDSASGLAKRLKLPRQTVNYHLRELEKEGFVEFVEQRLKGNCLERVMRAAARWYVISPAALGGVGFEEGEAGDRFSSAYLVRAAARAIRDVAVLRQRADRAKKTLATLTVETELRFASAQRRAEFSEELLQAVSRLVEKYHDEEASGGRSFRLVVGAYPKITKSEPAGTEPVRID